MDDASKLANMMPPEYSNEWYRQRLNAVEVLSGRLLATLLDELSKATHQVNAFRKEVSELRKDREKDAAKIGELMAMIDEQNKTIEKARAFVQKQQQKEVAA
jgi:chromosome segregation ATPase